MTEYTSMFWLFGALTVFALASVSWAILFKKYTTNVLRWLNTVNVQLRETDEFVPDADTLSSAVLPAIAKHIDISHKSSVSMMIVLTFNAVMVVACATAVQIPTLVLVMGALWNSSVVIMCRMLQQQYYGISALVDGYRLLLTAQNIHQTFRAQTDRQQ